jgi:hypothetical protein
VRGTKHIINGGGVWENRKCTAVKIQGLCQLVVTVKAGWKQCKSWANDEDRKQTIGSMRRRKEFKHLCRICFVRNITLRREGRVLAKILIIFR